MSTIKHAAEKPFLFDLLHYLPLYKLTKGEWRIKLLPYVAPFAGFTDSAEVRLFQSMLSQFDDEYRMWCIEQIIQWENDMLPTKTYHIHGTKDQIFPYKKIHQPISIKGGDHFMILRKGPLISKEIKKILKEDTFRPFRIVT